MNEDKKTHSRWLFGIPVLIILGGVLISVLLFRSSGIGTYPTLIADAYREEQHHLNVPGSMDIKLTRTGAYGIYYENSLVATTEDVRAKVPPAIDCSLTSQSTGVKVEAVPDFVETNRYWSRNKGITGVLIMSITVDNAGTYTFACNYQDSSTEPEVVVALSPNYLWEFLRVAGRISLSLFFGVCTLSGSILLALIILILVIILKPKKLSPPLEARND